MEDGREWPGQMRIRRWTRGLRVAVAAVVVTLVAGHAAPAGSQSTEPLELREGLWVGESIAWASLTGSAEGASATFDGVIGTEFTMFVDDESVVDGDWILDGDAVMLLSGSVNGDIVFDYKGAGALTGDQQTIEMAGDINTSALMTVGGLSFPAKNAQPFAIPIQLMNADCYAVDGDWIFPLDAMAEDAEWSSRDITGWFYAAYFGDSPDEELVEEVQQLWADERAWSDAALENAEVDLGEVAVLMIRAQILADRIAEADECLYEQTGHPDDFKTLFTIVITAGLLSVATFAELDGPNVQLAAMALHMIGDSNLSEPTSQAIHRQVERIINENMASDGDTCDPCMTSGDTGEVASAALAALELGETVEVGGNTYTPERIIQAVGVFEGAGG
jgi:hypothetical protein